MQGEGGMQTGRAGVGGKRENIDPLFHLSMHSLLDSCICPNGDRTPNVGGIGVLLSLSELPREGKLYNFKSKQM